MGSGVNGSQEREEPRKHAHARLNSRDEQVFIGGVKAPARRTCAVNHRRTGSSYVEMPVLGNSGTTMPALGRKRTSELEMPVLGKATYSGVEMPVLGSRGVTMPVLGSRGSAGIQMPVLGERYEYYDAADNRPASIIGQ